MRILVTLLAVLVLLWGVPTADVAATERFSVAPLIITEKGKARDIIKGNLSIENPTERKLTLYASVFDFDPSAGPAERQFAPGERKDDSLANWIEITRGAIELEPGETIQVPYLIHINLRARPGTYHAQLVFGAGGNRQLAQGSDDRQEVVVTVEVQDDIRERLQLATFMPDEQIFSGKTATFTFGLENTGNRSVAPRGEIRIYNRRGQEVATLPANGESGAIAPDTREMLASAWDASGRFGKYKAFLDLEYGQTGTVQDTVYFWVFPWREVMIGFFLLLILIGSVTYLIHLKLTYRYAYATLGPGGPAGPAGSRGPRGPLAPAPTSAPPAPTPEPEPEPQPAPTQRSEAVPLTSRRTSTAAHAVSLSPARPAPGPTRAPAARPAPQGPVSLTRPSPQPATALRPKQTPDAAAGGVHHVALSRPGGVRGAERGAVRVGTQGESSANHGVHTVQLGGRVR
ncbi:hypothetical protein GVX82_00030 [Patescibacteria group bacterium]|jgi:hypothetical protein|nr:hypothetical protein [Patescibacteria group bacterium]